MSDAATQLTQLQKHLIPYEDGWFPKLFLSAEYPTVEERFKYIKEFKYRPDDVLICTYLKCGTHWTGHLITRLVRVNEDDALPDVARHLEDSSYDYESKPSPRVIFTHLRAKHLPQEHLANGGKIVLCLRNPKDAAVSSFHHTNSIVNDPNVYNWEILIKGYMVGNVSLGSIFDYILKWDEFVSANKNPNVLVIFYEDLLVSGLETLRRIQSHLGLDKSDECLSKILSECSFKNLQQEASKFDTKDICPVFLNSEGKYAIYRKGQIGDWKNQFTVAQNEQFDTIMQEKLQHCSIGQRFLSSALI